MDTKPVNPLVKHFRQPSIYYKLPSQGKYWPDGSLDLPVTGEIPVYPMTTADEVMLRTPDALMNGQGIVNVMQSCCPNIKDAWQMPSVDVDAVLIAIRIASYGNEMDVDSKCPHCGEEHSYGVDLGGLIGQVKMPDFGTPVAYKDLKIKLRPQPYHSVTKASLVNYEEAKIVQSLNDSSLDDDTKNAQVAAGIKRMLDFNIKILVDSTEYIEDSEGNRVREPEFIEEFYRNAETQVIKEIEKRTSVIAQDGSLPPAKVQCTECTKPFEIPLVFDYSAFFGQGS